MPKRKSISLRAISWLILAVMLLASIPNCFVFADNPASVKGEISVSSASANPGETVELNVSISGNPGINTFTLGFDYDTECLTLQNVTVSAALGGQFTYAKKAVWLNSADSTYNGEILTLTFKINDNAPEGIADVSVTYQPGDIANYNEENVDFKLNAGSVTVGQESASQTAISVSSAFANPGETVDLKVSISGNPGINTFSLGFDYDTERLTLLNVTAEAALGGQFTYSKKAVWLNSTDSTYEGDILTLSFKVNDNAPAGNAAVKATYQPGDIANYNEENVDFYLSAGSVTVGQESASQTAISVSSVSANPGETVDLKVSISGNPGINTFSLGFDYDTDRLTLQNVTASDALGGQFTYSKKAVWLNSTDSTYNGEILTLTFKVNDNAPAGSAAVKATYQPGDISNYNEENVDFKLNAGAVNVGDSSASGFVISVSSAEAAPGDTVDLDVNISNNPGINTFSFGFEYDANALELTAVNIAPELGGQFTYAQKAVWLASQDTSFNGKILTLTFKVKSGAPLGAAAVSVTCAAGDISNYKEEDITFKLTAGQINVVGAYMLGDVDLNGKVDAVDARLALRAAAKLDTLTGIRLINADVDENNVINAIDARKILRVAAKLESMLPSNA